VETDGPVRLVAPAVDVIFLSASPVTSGEPDLEQLQSALQAQRIWPVNSTVITIEGPIPARARLAAALRPPEPAAEGGLAQAVGPTKPVPSVAVLDADMIVNSPPIGAVLDDPRVHTGALADPEGGGQAQLGVLKVDGADRALAAELAAVLPGPPEDLIFQLICALTEAGVAVQPVPLGGFGWARSAGPDGRRQVAAVDERTIRLREAARGGDGFYSTFVLRRMSWRLTGVAERAGLSPNQVTLMSFGLGLLGAAFLALGGRGWSVIGALLLQFCLVVDCVDGELARYRRRFSRFGAWLDATTDRVKEFAAVAALAIGAARSDHDLWWLVAAAIAVQTFRNLLDLGWALQRKAAAPPDDPSRPAESVPWVQAPAGIRAHGAVPVGPGAKSWMRRVGHFPIGERFLVVSLGAAFWSPRGTLITLLTLGLLSAAYMLAAFAVRSTTSEAFGPRIAALVDSGPVLGVAIRRLGSGQAGRLAALLPAVVAVLELAVIWLLGVQAAGGRGSAGVVLIAITAIAYYQHAYGVREENSGTQSWALGTDLRLLLLVVVAVLPAVMLRGSDGDGWATGTMWALAVLVGISSTWRSLRVWTDPQDRSRHAGGTQTMNGDNPSSFLREAIGGVR